MGWNWAKWALAGATGGLSALTEIFNGPAEKKREEKAAAEAKAKADKEQAEQTKKAKQAEEIAAGEMAETEATQTASTSAIQAQNSGLNRERAGMNSNINLANRSNANNALAGINASTQADYLNRIGQANALDQQANNMEKGALLNTLGSAVQGAGAGMKMGASMFGTSDENEKCPISKSLDYIKDAYSDGISDSEIIDKVNHLFEMKSQLDKLKENK